MSTDKDITSTIKELQTEALGIPAPDLRAPFNKGRFDSSAPAWRTISPGFSLQYLHGACNEYVDVSKGFFPKKNIGDLIYNNPCPHCGEVLQIPEIKAFLLWNCKFSWDGVLQEGNEKVQGSETFSGDTYHYTSGRIEEYFYLNVTSEEL